ncbi:hypothetical protein EAI30_13600 [Romboutsia ilealis]|uniref:Sigma factor n=1 Tax=Romboutsia faecis TaxID=2764597 RepID=A0ABR7JSS1_9FIRM|nr:hypothetical protein [Romboutsia faecis]MBC5997960.1 hypothetical protein [Romboutsia faecis]MRN25653.1 hypothetical protein [Romboutsia ilealis]
MSKDKKELFREVEARLYSYKDLDIKIKNKELQIEKKKNDYRGCGSISYDERTGVTYNISRSVEKEVVKREKDIAKLAKEKIDLEIEKQSIENALTALNSDENTLFEYFYNSRNKNTMTYIAIKMHRDRSYCYTIRQNLVYKVMGMLYPDYEELPLLNEKTTL